MNGSRTLLAFDFGHRRIGVAVGQEITGAARPLTTLPARDGQPDWAAVSSLLQHWRPDALVVGLPLHMDGSEQDTTHAARRFADRLQGRYHLPVYFADERLSSRAAVALIRQQQPQRRGRRRAERDGDVDAVAAQLILETFFSQDRNRDRDWDRNWDRNWDRRGDHSEKRTEKP